ncbi:hypothetical protein [Variovorax sp. PCZ-1]|uniref:hypothetical protein n=1 Tax=Variovorax sp. PCZ-1 TaxID=2835533 RepID=UPI001BCCE61D|nr:hypothetical protein [Variovorax sp. PCZ-1]MBS7806792.1 hypothetical protein [Variovorax sp. PCZ-1]
MLIIAAIIALFANQAPATPEPAAEPVAAQAQMKQGEKPSAMPINLPFENRNQ